MKRQLLCVIFILFFCISLLAQAPAWSWAKHATSSSPETAWDVTYDSNSGDIYTAGYFSGNLSAAYGSSLSASYGSTDGFLARYDQSGNVVWALKLGGTGNDEAHSVACDGSGNVYVSGFFTGTADFDPSSSTFTLAAAGQQDGFLAKYSSAGALIWATKFGGTNDENSWKMFADANGVYLTGSYESNPATFYSYSSATTKTTSISSSQLNAFGAKYNSSGVIQWVWSGGGSKDDMGFSVTADANNVFFIGRYDDDLVFKDASGATSTTLQAQQTNKPQVYILSVSQSGAFAWQNNITSSTGGDIVVGWSIAQDASNLYVTGYFDGNINFKYPSPTLTQSLSTGGNLDLFLAKLGKSAGTFSWNASVTGNGSGEQIGRALEVDVNGNVILAGVYTNSIDYSSASGPNHSSAGGHDVFITSYSNAGSFLWSVKAGGNLRDYVDGLAVDAQGNIFTCGEQDGNMVVGTTTLQSGGGNNVWIAKLGCAAITNNTITATQTVCAGSAPATFTGSLPVGGTNYSWQSSANNATWTAAAGTFTAQNYSATSLTATTYFRRVVSASGTCSTSTLNSNTITVFVITPPSTAAAGASQSVCASTATMAAASPTSGTGLWTLQSGTGSFSSASSFSSGVSGLSVGNNVFVWTVSNGICPTSSAVVTVLRYATPTSNAGSTQTVCSANATLAAINPTIGTGVWSVLTGTSTISFSTNPSSALIGLSSGSNQFVWTVSNGNCSSATATVTVLRDVQPISNAGSSQTVCSSSATLAAISPTIGNGLWSVQSGTATLTSASSFSSGVNGLSAGTNSFVWTVTNGSCPSATSVVSITRDLPPSSNAGASQTVCAALATLAAINPTLGTGIWSVATGGSSVTTTNSYSSQVSSLSTGINQFVWTVTNGTCPPATSSITIFRNIQPSANAGTAQSVCSSSLTLAATVPTAGTGSWSLLSGTGTVVAASNPSTQITGLGFGFSQFLWTVSNVACASATSAVQIIRDIPPTANAGVSQSVCSTSFTLAATIPTVGVGSWSVVTGSSSLTTPTSYSSGVTSLDAGQNQFLWTVTGGACPSATSMISINRDLPPSASAGLNQTICATSTTLAATSPTIGTGIWTLQAGTGTLSSATSFSSAVTGLGAGTNTFVWSVSNGVCPTASASVLILRYQFPLANAGSSQTLCSTTASLSAISPTIGSGSWSVLSGTSSISSATNPSSPVTLLSPGINQFVWTVTNGNCTAATSTVTITRDAFPVSTAGPSQTICTTTTSLSASSSTPGIGSWSLISGSGSVATTSNASSQVTGLNTGANSFMWTVSNGICPAATSTLEIFVTTTPTAFAGSNQTVCAPELTLSANPPLAGTGFWSVLQGSASIATPTDPASPVTGLATGTTILLWTVANGSCPTATSAVVLMQDVQPQSFAGNNQSICTSTTTLSAANPAVGSGVWTLLSGSGIINSTVSPASIVSAIEEGENQFVWTVTNGVCPPAISTVIITRDTLAGQVSAGSDFTICSSSTTLAGLYNAPGLAAWSVSTGNAVFTSSTSPVSTVSNLSTGLNEFIYVNTNGSCPPETDTVKVFVNVPLPAASAGNDQQLCSTECTLSANNGSGNWSVLSGSAVLTSSTSPVTAVTALSTGTNIFIWTVSQDFCPSTVDTLIVLRNENLGLVSAGTDQVLCGSTATLAALPVINGEGEWKALLTTNIITDANQAQTSVEQLNPGLNAFIWSVTNANCPTKSDTVFITSDAIPSTAVAGTDLLVCQDDVTLEGTPPSVGSGNWTLLSGSGTFVDPKNAETIISGVKEGLQVLLWTVGNGVCPQNSDTVKITRTFTPINPDAGIDQVIETSTVQLTATIPQSGLGTWSVVSGSCTFSDVHDKEPVISALPFGNTILKWTIANKSCPDVSDDIVIRVKELNIPNAFSPNGDGINDKFVITSLAYYNEVKLSIFNRWGTLLYHSSDYQNNWGGEGLGTERLADDTYYYIIEIPGLKNVAGFVIIKQSQ